MILTVTAATSVLLPQVSLPLPLPVSWPCGEWQWTSAPRRGENDQVLNAWMIIMFHIMTQQGPITIQQCTFRQPCSECLNSKQTNKIKALHKFQGFSRKDAERDTRGATVPFITVPWGEAIPLKSFSFILVQRFLSVELPLSAVLPALQVRIRASFIVWVSAVMVSATERFWKK